jgi:hypothetical protein
MQKGIEVKLEIFLTLMLCGVNDHSQTLLCSNTWWGKILWCPLGRRLIELHSHAQKRGRESYREGERVIRFCWKLDVGLSSSKPLLEISFSLGNVLAAPDQLNVV